MPRKSAIAILALVLALAVALPAPAGAQWADLKPTGGDDLLFSVGRDDSGLIWVGGMIMKMGGDISNMTMQPVLKRSLDGGKSWLDSGAGLASGSFDPSPIMDLHMLSQWAGWVVLGERIAVQQNQVGNWKKVELEATPAAFHIFDLSRGVAVGAKGYVWTTADGGQTWDVVTPGDGTDVDFTTLQCFGNGRCFAAGQVSEEIELEQGSQTRYKNWEVWTSTNHGRNWTKAYGETPSAENGQAVGPLWFLEDGVTGWLVVADWDMENGRTRNVRLLRTDSGGEAFHQVGGFDPKVGELNNTLFGGMKTPITLDTVGGMYWADARRGRLVGAAYLTDDQSGGGGGSPPPIYQRTDFVTTDGGKTWTKPDLGVVTIDFMGGQMPAGEPRPFAAHFDNWIQGLVVGEKGLVQALRIECTMHSQCAPLASPPPNSVPGEFMCAPESADTFVCVPNPDWPGPDACPGCEDTGGTDRDAVQPPEDAAAGGDLIASGDIRIPNDGGGGGSGGGCAAGTVPGTGTTLPLLLLGLGLAALARMRTRRIR
jgi:hypothetical protein